VPVSARHSRDENARGPARSGTAREIKRKLAPEAGRRRGGESGRLPPRRGNVVPADKKWFTRLVVAAAIVDALWSLDLHFPRVTGAQRKELAATRQKLLKAK
jgi:hypothetical protein